MEIKSPSRFYASFSDVFYDEYKNIQISVKIRSEKSVKTLRISAEKSGTNSFGNGIITAGRKKKAICYKQKPKAKNENLEETIKSLSFCMEGSGKA